MSDGGSPVSPCARAPERRERLVVVDALFGRLGCFSRRRGSRRRARSEPRVPSRFSAATGVGRGGAFRRSRPAYSTAPWPSCNLTVCASSASRVCASRGTDERLQDPTSGLLDQSLRSARTSSSGEASTRRMTPFGAAGAAREARPRCRQPAGSTSAAIARRIILRRVGRGRSSLRERRASRRMVDGGTLSAKPSLQDPNPFWARSNSDGTSLCVGMWFSSCSRAGGGRKPPRGRADLRAT